MRCLLRPLIAIRIKATYEIKAVLFFSYTFHNITGVDEPCHLKQNKDALDRRQRQQDWTSLGEWLFKSRQFMTS